MNGEAKSDFVKNRIQGKYQLELAFIDNRVYLSYWDSAHGRDVLCQVVDGKLMELVYTEEECEAEGFNGDPFETIEISFQQFIEKTKESISQISI